MSPDLVELVGVIIVVSLVVAIFLGPFGGE